MPEEKLDLKKAAALYDCHIKQCCEAGLYQHYADLPAGEVAAFVDLFIADDKNLSDRNRIDLLLYLALFSYSCGEHLPDKLYRWLIDNEIFYYGELYLRADEKFAGELIAALNTIDDPDAYTLAANHILCALSMMPCRKVNDFLITSSKQPLPIWAQKLCTLPQNYAYVGGWETSADSKPRLLISRNITAFERCAKVQASPASPVTPLAEACGFCGRPLTLVFDGDKKLAACLYCSCYQTVFTKLEAGAVHWHSKNAPEDSYSNNDEDIAARFKYGIRPTDEKRRASWTASQFAEISLTQIGGMPTAINDMYYPACPECGKTMRFAAQFDTEDVDEYGEGLYYFFVCDDCDVVGVNYDQS